MGQQSKSYFKNFVLLFTGNSVSQIIPFILAPIIGRIFSPEQLAVQENFLAIVALLAIIAAGRYEIAFVLPKTGPKANNLFALTLIILASVTLLSLLLLFFPEQISAWYRDNELGKYILFVAPAVLLLGLNNIFIQWMIRFGKYSWVTAGRITQSIVQYGGYALLGYLGWGIKGLIIAMLIGNLAPAIMLLFPSLKNFSSKDVNAEEIRSVAHEYKDFPIINSLHAFTDIFATQFILFWLITRNYGAAALGLFAIMNRYLRAPLSLIGSAVGQLYYREASNAKNNNESIVPVFNRSVRITALASVPAMLIIFFFGPDIFAVYLGEKWRLAGEYARIMAPALLFISITSPVSATPLIFQKQKNAYLLSTAAYVLMLGSVFFGAHAGYEFKTIVIFYSVNTSLFYLVLYIWYRNLIKEKIQPS
jgi:O-antigen/teichoic acid export membrane protein